MSARYDTVSFLSDYGHDDEFVGVVTSVLRDLAPHAGVVHLTHGVTPHDVRGGSLALARSIPYVCAGVVLAVVDPGVGTARRGVAVEVQDGAGVFVGPDNGLLAPAVAMAGGATRAVTLANAEYQLDAPGATFAGRDVFAPAAAHLCNGVPLAELGPEIDAGLLVPGLVPLTRREGDAVVGEVLWVDRYGNAQLNVDPDEIDHLAERVQLRAGGVVRTCRRATAYGDLPPGQVGLVVDGSGLLSVVLDRASAAAELGLHEGSEVTLADPEDEPRPGVAVQLGRR